VIIFRGITAAASLKQGDLGEIIGWPVTIFRGITAAASLKLDALTTQDSDPGKSSAASLPRPH